MRLVLLQISVSTIMQGICIVSLASPAFVAAYWLQPSLARPAFVRSNQATCKGHSMADCGMPPPPIVWTIAGSDSGGGAGVQADLLAIHAFGCHGCSIITALTAQNSYEVRQVEAVSKHMLRDSIEVLQDDLPAVAIKVGMLATAEIVKEVGRHLKYLTLETPRPAIICDPVMVTSSGSSLLEDDARALLAADILPLASLITPNKPEAEVLAGRLLHTARDVEEAARELLRSLGCGAVLIKGGHSFSTGAQSLAQDFLLSNACSDSGGLWLTSERVDNANTHGTGCTLSSAIAALMAQKYSLEDAVVLGKAYINKGIREAYRLGRGPGPVRQTNWPQDARDFPWATRLSADTEMDRIHPFPSCPTDISTYACVESAEHAKEMADCGIKHIQIRVKNKPMQDIEQQVRQAAATCHKMRVHLWVNDYWEVALRCNTYGVHIGQEDLLSLQLASGGRDGTSPLEQLKRANIRLGVSTHTFSELACATALRPSYISLGPIFATTSKQVAHAPQGLARIRQWKSLIGDTPLVVIGGITLAEAALCYEAGADGICVIRALSEAANLREAVREWQAIGKKK